MAWVAAKHLVIRPRRHIGSPSQNQTEVARFRAESFVTKLKGINWSAWEDSNLRQRASKARTLTKLSYTQLYMALTGRVELPCSSYGSNDS